MSFRRSDTIGDLVEQGFRLLLACRNCGNLRTLAPAALLERVGPARRWTTLRFRCQRCGGRDVLSGLDRGRGA